MKHDKPSSDLTYAFTRCSEKPGCKKRSRTEAAKTFSIRLNEAERQLLTKEAGKRPLGTYIRSKVLGDAPPLRKAGPPPKKLYSPSADQKSIARILAFLGKSDLHSSLRAIAKSALMGTLPVEPEIVEAEQDACADIRAMRTSLMDALGTGGSHGSCR